MALDGTNNFTAANFEIDIFFGYDEVKFNPRQLF